MNTVSFTKHPDNGCDMTINGSPLHFTNPTVTYSTEPGLVALNINGIIYHFRLSEYTVTINGVEQTGTPAEIVSKLQTEVFTAPGGAVEVAVYQRKTVLTDAQIKALPTTPVELVPAPGVGKFLTYHSAVVLRKPFAAGYTNISNNDTIYIDLDDYGVSRVFTDNVESGLQDLSELLGGYAPEQKKLWTVGINGGTRPNMMGINGSTDNEPLRLVGMASGNWTGGHANNTLEVTVFYSIVDL